jgi:hypothetical protein
MRTGIMCLHFSYPTPSALGLGASCAVFLAKCALNLSLELGRDDSLGVCIAIPSRPLYRIMNHCRHNATMTRTAYAYPTTRSASELRTT